MEADADETLAVQAEQHHPLAAQSVREAAEDDPAQHHAAEVDRGDQGRDVGSVTHQLPLKQSVHFANTRDLVTVSSFVRSRKILNNPHRNCS